VARILGPDGSPASGARAQLAPLDGDAGLEAAGASRLLGSLFSGEGASDSEGRLDLGRFAPGEYRLEAQRGFSRTTLPRVQVPAAASAQATRSREWRWPVTSAGPQPGGTGTCRRSSIVSSTRSRPPTRARRTGPPSSSSEIDGRAQGARAALHEASVSRSIPG